MSDQQYCLRWNNHQPNFITVFKSLLELEELVDVTLSVEGRNIKAHKVILSACSPYFKLLFTMTPCKHPIIIFNDIKYMDLKTIIDFMYCGEINISDEQLPNVLEAAKVLQVRGLYEPNKKSESSSSENLPSTKKRKKKSEIMTVNTEYQNNLIPEQRFEEGSSEEVKFDEMHDSKDWFGVNDQSHNNEYMDVMDVFHPNISFKNNDESPVMSKQEDTNYSSFSNQMTPYESQDISRPVSSPFPVRRRNSKVQESKNFLLALEAVRSGSLGFCKAAKLYGLNNRTLWLEYKKRGYPSTRPPVAVRHKNNALSAKPS